jgi:hypothetical protein
LCSQLLALRDLLCIDPPDETVTELCTAGKSSSGWQRGCLLWITAACEWRGLPAWRVPIDVCTAGQTCSGVGLPLPFGGCSLAHSATSSADTDMTSHVWCRAALGATSSGRPPEGGNTLGFKRQRIRDGTGAPRGGQPATRATERRSLETGTYYA